MNFYSQFCGLYKKACRMAGFFSCLSFAAALGRLYSFSSPRADRAATRPNIKAPQMEVPQVGYSVP